MRTAGGREQQNNKSKRYSAKAHNHFGPKGPRGANIFRLEMFRLYAHCGVKVVNRFYQLIRKTGYQQISEAVFNIIGAANFLANQFKSINPSHSEWSTFFL